MKLPIEIINHIAQFTDYETYNALKCTSKEINSKVQNYDVLKKYTSSLVCEIFNECIAIEFTLSSKYMFVSKNAAILHCINSNPDRFSCMLCGFPVDCTSEGDLITHLHGCMGRNHIPNHTANTLR